MSDQTEQSYDHCRNVARQAASSFYLSFYLLSPERRRAMYALYAYLRKTDDLGDSDAPLYVRRAALDAWRDSLAAALTGRTDDPILPALVDTVRRYVIPTHYLTQVIDGVEMDLNHEGFETFDQLKEYCHCVASSVGLACLHIWGFRDVEAFVPAEKCGLAFQLTNILRDLKEDAARGRMYLPREDFRRFDYTPEELAEGVRDERFRRLIHFEIERAEQYYREAYRLRHYLEPEGCRALAAMMGTYHRLLVEIRRQGGDVFARRVRVGTFHKFRIAAQSYFARPRPERLVEKAIPPGGPSTAAGGTKTP